jgi:hypothetical protein
MQQRLEQRQTPTMADIKQLACALLFVVPMLAIVSFGLSRMLGVRTALWLSLAFGIFVATAFACIVAVSIGISYAHGWLLRRRGNDER